VASIAAAMSPAYWNTDMETLKVAVSAELYLPYNGILAYQFDLPDELNTPSSRVTSLIACTLRAVSPFYAQA
jgi:hypothetical protein